MVEGVMMALAFLVGGLVGGLLYHVHQSEHAARQRWPDDE